MDENVRFLAESDPSATPSYISPSRFSEPESLKKSKKPLIITAISGIVLLSAAAFILIFSGNLEETEVSTTETASEYLGDEGDATEELEILNPVLASATQLNPNSTYETTLTSTTLFDSTPAEVVERFSLSRADLAHPESSEKFEKVLALNSNALNFHLDHNNIVVIIASDSDYYSVPVIVFAADYTVPIYHIFRPDSIEVDFASRVDIFNNIPGLADFYIVRIN